MEKDDIIIRKAILHILDSTVGMPVLSQEELELSPDLNDFLREHIYKIVAGDDSKLCEFHTEETYIAQCLLNFQEEELVSISQGIASHLYTIMNQNIDIPAADLFIVTYQYESELHLALLKMNYKEYYVHYTESKDSGNKNDIVKQTAALPGTGSRLSEACVIHLGNKTMQVVERKYEINGEKVLYFSELFLCCSTEMSQKSKLNIVTKAVEQINKKYFESDFSKRMEAKSIIHGNMIEQGSITPEAIGEKLYGDIPEIKEEFTEKLEKYNLVTEEVKPKSAQTVKKFEKQFLTTDSGIEINIPMEEYNNKQNIEFITNNDGTISVLIKNITNLISK